MYKNLKLRIASSAYQTIMEESMKWDGMETGTVLVGTQESDGFTVTDAIGPGPKAKRSWGSFSPDVDYVNMELQRIRSLKTVDFLGVHHLHPGDMHYPSGGDKTQAIEMLTDPDYKINGKLLCFISIKNGKSVVLHPYLMTKENPVFKPIKYEIINDLNLSKANRTGNTLSVWACDKASTKRLADELKSIEEMLNSKPIVKIIKNGLTAIEIEKIVFVLPNEYPLNPPRIFIRKRKRLKEVILGEQMRWSSTFDILELLSHRRLKNFVRDERQRQLLKDFFKKMWIVLKRPCPVFKQSKQLGGEA